MALNPQVVVVMGVSGAGKTTVGSMLAERLGWEFADADDYHPPANVAKMASGQPLNDADRAPWLQALQELSATKLSQNRSLVLACSALKASYRDVIAAGDPRIRFVFLHGSFELIQARLQERSGHYMPAALLRSQFDALEEPDDAMILDIGPPPTDLVATIIAWLDS